jgi:hypothetical protein
MKELTGEEHIATHVRLTEHAARTSGMEDAHRLWQEALVLEEQIKECMRLVEQDVLHAGLVSI